MTNLETAPHTAWLAGEEGLAITPEQVVRFQQSLDAQLLPMTPTNPHPSERDAILEGNGE